MIFRNFYGQGGRTPKKEKKNIVTTESIPNIMNDGVIKPMDNIKPIKLKNDKSKGNIKFIF